MFNPGIRQNPVTGTTYFFYQMFTYTNVLWSSSRLRNFTSSSSISAENYSTTNDITDSPTPTFATNPTLQERSESFTTRVSSETTTSGNFLSSSDLFPVHSTTDSHVTTQTMIDDLTSIGNVSTATVDIHSTDSATDITTDSNGSTQTVIDNLTSNGNVSTATVDIHSSDSATDKTNPISLASTDSAITLSHSGVSIQMEATDSTTSLPDLTTPIQDSSTSTESTNSNTSLCNQFS